VRGVDDIDWALSDGHSTGCGLAGLSALLDPSDSSRTITSEMIRSRPGGDLPIAGVDGEHHGDLAVAVGRLEMS